MIINHAKLALSNIRRARVRSFLTMLGVVIGVASVVSTVSLGEGLKNQVVQQVNANNEKVISIRPGQVIKKDSSGNQIGINWSAMFGSANSLTNSDVEVLQGMQEISKIAPIGVVSGSINNNENRAYEGGTILAIGNNMLEIMNIKLARGDNFKEENTGKNSAIVSRTIAESLYGESFPLGQVINLKGQDFIIRAITEDLPVNPLNFGTDYNTAVFINYSAGKELSDDKVQIREIVAELAGPDLDASFDKVSEQMLLNHGKQEDFSVLRQKELLEITDQAFTVVTGFVAAIAAISLFVGGIGIMNIMLVSVSERTREIGVRKAIGATNKQIMSQFLTESVILSILGGIAGITVSVIGTGLLRIFTNLQPTINPFVLILASVLSVIVGVVFGVTPAFQASRKDPIQALRHE